jgi:hypothetical protein
MELAKTLLTTLQDFGYITEVQHQEFLQEEKVAEIIECLQADPQDLTSLLNIFDNILSESNLKEIITFATTINDKEKVRKETEAAEAAKKSTLKIGVWVAKAILKKLQDVKSHPLASFQQLLVNTEQLQLIGEKFTAAETEKSLLIIEFLIDMLENEGKDGIGTKALTELLDKFTSCLDNDAQATLDAILQSSGVSKDIAPILFENISGVRQGDVAQSIRNIFQSDKQAGLNKLVEALNQPEVKVVQFMLRALEELTTKSPAVSGASVKGQILLLKLETDMQAMLKKENYFLWSELIQKHQFTPALVKKVNANILYYNEQHLVLAELETLPNGTIRSARVLCDSIYVLIPRVDRNLNPVHNSYDLITQLENKVFYVKQPDDSIGHSQIIPHDSRVAGLVDGSIPNLMHLHVGS